MRVLIWLATVAVLMYARLAAAQGSSSAPHSTQAPSSTQSNVTSFFDGSYLWTSTFLTTLSPNQPRPSGVANSQSVLTITSTITSEISSATSTMNSASSSTAASPSVDPNLLPLHTIIDPAFGMIGAFLIVTGLPLAFIGHRSEWYVCLATGLYSLAIITLSLILRFGQARAVNDPSQTLKGVFVLACFCAGMIGGILTMIFRQGGLLLCCSLGGFAFALFLQACRPKGLIEVIGLRYILYLGFITLCFAFSCFPRLHHPTLIFATAAVGSTATVLGIDCFTRSNLKEFYVRNLGFDDLFYKRYPQAFANSRWPLSTAVIIELGILAGLAVMAMALQGRMWAQLKANVIIMRQQDREKQKQEECAETVAKEILVQAQGDLRTWRQTHNENENTAASTSHTLLYRRDTDDTEIEAKTECPHVDLPAQKSGLLSSELAASMGLGSDDVPPDVDRPQASSTDEILAKEKLLDEIAAIRKSISVLRSTSPVNTVTLSSDAAATFPMVKSHDTRLSHTSAFTMPALNMRRSSSPWILCAQDQGSRHVQEDKRWTVHEGGHGLHVQPEKIDDALPFHFSASSLPFSPAMPLEIERPHRHFQTDRIRSRSLSPVSLPQERTQGDRIVVGTPRNPIFSGPSSPTAQHGGETDRRIPVTRRMTGDKLQARHNARLSAMQNPLSTRLNEEAALAVAKQQWQKRTAEERKRWLQKEVQKPNLP